MLRRYKRRWKIERLFAWLQNFRRIAMRFDFHDENISASSIWAALGFCSGAIYETASSDKTFRAMDKILSGNTVMALDINSHYFAGG